MRKPGLSIGRRMVGRLKPRQQRPEVRLRGLPRQHQRAAMEVRSARGVGGLETRRFNGTKSAFADYRPWFGGALLAAVLPTPLRPAPARPARPTPNGPLAKRAPVPLPCCLGEGQRAKQRRERASQAEASSMASLRAPVNVISPKRRAGERPSRPPARSSIPTSPQLPSTTRYQDRTATAGHGPSPVGRVRPATPRGPVQDTRREPRMFHPAGTSEAPSAFTSATSISMSNPSLRMRRS